MRNLDLEKLINGRVLLDVGSDTPGGATSDTPGGVKSSKVLKAGAQSENIADLNEEATEPLEELDPNLQPPE